MAFLCKTRVAIIGRPNVGKSTLFNILVGARKSLVKNQPGVTRDILIEEAELWGKTYDLIDTGGLTRDSHTFSKMIFEQVSELISSVDLLLVVMDGRAGLCPEDREVLRIATESGKPFLTIINKVDQVSRDEEIKSDFYGLGVDLASAAFEKRWGLSEILEWLSERVFQAESNLTDQLTLAIVGKPNVGKSSLSNYLLKEKRMLVSDIAGTTVDPVESQFEYDGKVYNLIDTAGLRRSARRTEEIEKLSAFKSESSIRRADIVLLLVDGPEGPTAQDARIVEEIREQKKTVLLVANKSDIGKSQVKAYRSQFRAQAAEIFHFFPDIPIEFISAKTGSGIPLLFQQINDLWAKLHIRVSTSKLNEFFIQAIRKAPSPVFGTKNVKFYYLTQTRQVPPSFIAFANHPEGVIPSYRRFLTNQIKEKWSLSGIPVQIHVVKSK